MKKFCISICLIVIIILTAACGLDSGSHTEREYLRIHVRANSDSDEDQKVKYAVKDAVVAYLTPLVAECGTKDAATDMIIKKSRDIERLTDEVLRSNGFYYGCSVLVRNEKFPTRVYEDVTLESGYYSAVIIELGRAEGKNWWCVVYPPLCFTSGKNVVYRSKIKEIIEEFKRKFS